MMVFIAMKNYNRISVHTAIYLYSKTNQGFVKKYISQ